jgi:hypothetical protein
MKWEKRKERSSTWLFVAHRHRGTTDNRRQTNEKKRKEEKPTSSPSPSISTSIYPACAAPSYPVDVPGRTLTLIPLPSLPTIGESSPLSSTGSRFTAPAPLALTRFVLGRRAAARGGDSTAFFSSLSAFSFVAVALEAVVADGAGTVPVIVACKLVSSRIIVSLSAALSACTVCACCRRLSSRENCLEQWHVKGRSPVCFLDKRKERVSIW